MNERRPGFSYTDVTIYVECDPRLQIYPKDDRVSIVFEPDMSHMLEITFENAKVAQKATRRLMGELDRYVAGDLGGPTPETLRHSRSMLEEQ